jgi:hypothetical protein
MSETDAQQPEVDADETRDALRRVYGDPEDGQHYNDRSKLDFDPADGVYSGTAVDGTSEIAGPHENQDEVTPEQKEELRDDDDVTEGVQQRATEGEEAARHGQDRTAGTEAAMRKEPGDVAAGQEIDSNASR